MKKMITMFVSLVACLVFAGTATAAPVVWNLTADGGDLGGTLTFDNAIAPTSTDGGTGNHTYTHATAALPAFSFTRNGTTGIFDNLNDTVFELYLITDASFSPLFLLIDIDDDGGSGDFLYTETILDLTLGTGKIVGPGELTGVALTPAGGDGGTLTTFK